MDSANFTRHNVSCDHCDTLLCLLLNGWQRQIVTIMCNHNTFPPVMSSLSPSFRHLEISFPRADVSGVLAVIPSLRSRASSERSEGSLRPASEIVRCAHDDRP